MKKFCGVLSVVFMSLFVKADIEVGDWKVSSYDLEKKEAILGAYIGSSTHVTVPSQIMIPECEYDEDTKKWKDAWFNTILGDSLFEFTDVVSVSLGYRSSIPDYCFSACFNLTSVSSSSKITSIGTRAFDRCGSLCTLPSLSEVSYIGFEAFYNCSSLSGYLELPKLGYLGISAFEGCSGLKSCCIGGSAEIQAMAFVNCTSLEKVELMGGVSFTESFWCEIAFDHQGDWVPPFVGCSGLREVILGGGVYEIPAGTFSGLSLLADIKVSLALKEIGEGAFLGCSMLKISSLASVTNIGANAFSGCSSWKGPLDLSNAEIIEESAFKDCKSLESVRIGDKIRSVGEGIFYGCSSLKDVSIEGVGDCVIYGEAFSECSSLEICVLGDGVKKLDYDTLSTHNSPFYNCTNIRTVIMKNISTIPKYLLPNNESLETVDMPNATRINEDAFSGCPRLKNISSLACVTNIGSWAFRGCSSWKGPLDLSNAEIIEESAFKDCSSLTGKVHLAKLKTIENGIFSGCKRIRQVKFGGDLEFVRADAFNGSTNVIAFTFEGTPPEADDNAFRNVKKGALGIYPTSTLKFNDTEETLCSVQTLSETPKKKEWCDVIAEDGTWKKLLMAAVKPILTNDVYDVNKGSLRLNWDNESTPDYPKDYGITYEIRRGFSDNYETADILTNGYDQLQYVDKQFDFTGGVSRIWYWVKPEHECAEFKHSDSCRTKNRYVLNVGINNYKNNSQKPLSYCVSDAIGWMNLLRKNGTDYKTLTDSDATKQFIKDGIATIRKMVVPGDLFVYTHSSHGNENLLCCYDDNITASEFGNLLKQFSKYTRIVIMLDSCYSGSIPSGIDARSMQLLSASQSTKSTFAESVIQYMDLQKMRTLSNEATSSNADTISSSSEIGWLTAVSKNEKSQDGVYFQECLQSAGWTHSGADFDDDNWITFEDLGRFAEHWMGRMNDQYGMTPQMFNGDRLKALAGKVKAKEYKRLDAPVISVGSDVPPYEIHINLPHDIGATGYVVRAYNNSNFNEFFTSPESVIRGKKNGDNIKLTLKSDVLPVSSDSYNIYVKAVNPMDVSEHSNEIQARMRESDEINNEIRTIDESRPDNIQSLVNDDGSNNYKILNQDHDGDGISTFNEVLSGSNPFNGTSQFTANITMDNGKPKVTPNPDLGDKRKYTIYGKKDLSSSSADWTDMSAVQETDKPEYRFFKVGVSLP